MSTSVRFTTPSPRPPSRRPRVGRRRKNRRVHFRRFHGHGESSTTSPDHFTSLLQKDGVRCYKVRRTYFIRTAGSGGEELHVTSGRQEEWCSW